MDGRKHSRYLKEQVFLSGKQATNGTDEEFLRCWGKGSCDQCLGVERCSWCPYTWTCVPNNHTYPLLAPFHGNVCPHMDEQWEVRTRPFGCSVSTRNFASVVVSVFSTIGAALLVWLLVWGIGKFKVFNKRHPGWLRDVVNGVRARISKTWWRRKGGAEAEALLAGGAGGEDMMPEQV